ncbi:MAG TPA: RNA 2',3'-cyclic phosphodiesterase [Gammaproteobacteria bacterium]|nr:RNA 2',3'-cyclic phosphodiesterase [Gammaproteobacteria bacterium]
MKPKRVNHFFAIRPAASIQADLLQVQRQCETAGQQRKIAPTDLHCTLLFLGPLELSHQEPLCELAQQIKVKGFSLSFDCLNFWRAPKIACLTTEVVPMELFALVEHLYRGCDALGYQLQRREYRPHITLMRRMNPFPSRYLERPLTWFVETFYLFRSPGAGETGYQVLDYWKLDQ